MCCDPKTWCVLPLNTLGTLRPFDAVGQVGDRLHRLDQLLPVGRALHSPRLHRLLDEEQRLPGREHVAVGRHVLAASLTLAPLSSTPTAAR
jgi:hypothetical protein